MFTIIYLIDSLLQRLKPGPRLLRRAGQFALQGPYSPLRGVYACQGARDWRPGWC